MAEICAKNFVLHKKSRQISSNSRSWTVLMTLTNGNCSRVESAALEGILVHIMIYFFGTFYSPHNDLSADFDIEKLSDLMFFFHLIYTLFSLFSRGLKKNEANNSRFLFFCGDNLWQFFCYLVKKIYLLLFWKDFFLFQFVEQFFTPYQWVYK